jgi:hypothetical protein
MIDLSQLQSLLSEVPDGATIRVVASGASTYVMRDAIELTSEIEGDFIRIRGLVGTSPNEMTPGGLVIRADRVDFIQVTT